MKRSYLLPNERAWKRTIDPRCTFPRNFVKLPSLPLYFQVHFVPSSAFQGSCKEWYHGISKSAGIPPTITTWTSLRPSFRSRLIEYTRLQEPISEWPLLEALFA